MHSRPRSVNSARCSVAERGEFHHPGRARQLLSFTGMRWGKITPTDFDLFIDFHGDGFVLGELKLRDAPLLRGQELALERAADTWDRGGVPCLTIVASHSVDVGNVIVADAIVTRFRFAGRWVKMRDRQTVAWMVERFYRRCVERAA